MLWCPFGDGPCGEDTDVTENLFSEVPVLGGRPAAELCLAEQIWNDDPGIRSAHK